MGLLAPSLVLPDLQGVNRWGFLARHAKLEHPMMTLSIYISSTYIASISLGIFSGFLLLFAFALNEMK